MKQKAEGGLFKRIYFGIAIGERFLGNFLLLLIRIYWGGMLVITGLGKLMNIHGVADYFASLDLPSPLFTAYVIAFIELLGGASLFLGLFSRLFSILLVTILIGAYVTAYPEAISSFFIKPSLFIIKDPFHFLYATLIVLCFGPGFISFDYWLEKKTYGMPL